MYLYLPDRNYLSSFPVLVFNSNLLCAVQPDLFDLIALFLKHHAGAERDHGSWRVDQIFSPQNTTYNSVNSNVNLPVVTTQHNNAKGWSEGLLVSHQSLSQDLASLAPVLTNCVDFICSKLEVNFNVVPFSDDWVINLFAN
eukprot:8753929-Ditylum_brightwellii.AAC.1